MKKITWITLMLSLVVCISLTVSGVMAKDTEGTKIKIPNNTTDIIQEIKVKETELSQTVADKKLENVHHLAFAIRDLVNALPAKSQNLGTEKLDKLKANAKFVVALAQRLDTSGDANDQAATETNLIKLQTVLKAIEALY